MALNWQILSTSSDPNVRKQALRERLRLQLDAFEPPPNAQDRLRPVLVRGNITIGIGFDLQAGGRNACYGGRCFFHFFTEKGSRTTISGLPS